MIRSLLLLPAALVLLAGLMSGCSSFYTSSSKEGTTNASNRARYDETGGSRVETAIWSNDPKKKTLPQAIGETLE